MVSLVWLPVAGTVSIVSAALSSYGISVSYNHTFAVFPYISDAANFNPESSVFAQLMNISAVLAGLVFYVRYKMLRLYFQPNGNHHKLLLRTNTFAFILGLIMACGISVIGCFQHVSVPVLHLIGAMAAFAVGIVYNWIHSVLSIYTSSKSSSSRAAGQHQSMTSLNGSCVVAIRFILCLTSTLTFIIYRIFLEAASRKFDGDSLHWPPQQEGYTEHLLSTAFEWALFFSNVAFILSFAVEFRHIRWISPQIQFKGTTAATGLPEKQAAECNNGQQLSVIGSARPGDAFTDYGHFSVYGFSTSVVVNDPHNYRRPI